MENDNSKLLYERIKNLGKQRGKTIKDIQDFFELSGPGLRKRIESENFPYSKSIHELALWFRCSVEEILEGTQPEEQPEVSENEAKEIVESYYKTHQHLDDTTLLHVMKAENLLLKQIIERQEKEIEFLRGQMTK